MLLYPYFDLFVLVGTKFKSDCMYLSFSCSMRFKCSAVLIVLLNFDRKHVVFGKLVNGRDTLKRIERVDTDETRPVVPVKIVNCGELLDSKSQGATMQKNGNILKTVKSVGLLVLY